MRTRATDIRVRWPDIASLSLNVVGVHDGVDEQKFAHTAAIDSGKQQLKSIASTVLKNAAPMSFYLLESGRNVVLC